MMEHGSVFIHALQHSSIPEPIPTPPIKTKKQNQQQGIYCYRIEELELVPCSSFCTADCMIVVSMDPERSFLFTWIGTESNLEKQCACAMWAVTLRQKLGLDESIQRIEQGSEPDVFLEWFPDFHVLDASYGTRSLLRPVVGPVVVPRLYCWQGHGVLVPLESVLESEYVYLYVGHVLAQWNGAASRAVDRCKAGLLLSTLGHDIQVFEQGQEGFEDLLQSHVQSDSSRSSTSLPKQRCSHSELYSVEEEEMEMVQKEKWDTEPVLYRLEETPVCVPRPWHPSLLCHVSFVLDLGVELYVWHLPHTLLNGLQGIVSSRVRPVWFRVERVAPGAEPFLFRWFFGDWRTPPVPRSIVPHVYPTVERRERIPYTLQEIESWFEKVNTFVRDRQCFVYTHGSYEPFHGTQYDLSGAYFFLYDYEAPAAFFEQWEQEELGEWEEGEMEYRTVGYFVTTSKTTHKARYILYYQFLPSLPSPLVLECQWGWEHPCLLAHLGNIVTFVVEGVMELRTDKRFKTTRIMGVDCMSSNACYYYDGVVWKGSNVSSHAWDVCSHLLGELFEEVRVCEEWNQDMQDWFGVDLIQVPGIPLQWFVLCASQGKLTVEYRRPTHRDILFVECGDAFVWIGVEASELLLRWMDTLSHPDHHIEHQYYESPRFKKLFSLWL
jgi:hypothetical protein